MKEDRWGYPKMLYTVWGAVALAMLMISYYDAVESRRRK